MDTANLFQRNTDWELDRAEMLARSERRAWHVAAGAVVLALLGLAAVAVQGPLRQVVGIPIVVDRQTGETTIQQRLSEETVPMHDALDKHHLAQFVRAREGYSWWWLQRDYDQVARMAVPAVFAPYQRLFDGDAGLHKRLASHEEWRIEIVSVRLAPGGRQGNRGEAIVTYDKRISRPDRSLPDQSSRHVASVVYDYQPRVLTREKDRLENPFGFVVVAYRSDPEIGGDAVATAGRP
ncbi:virB8 family protein [Rubrivivax albus]|uniref:Type IV secretion system protein n=1 Tax=Rubrivivax albus TaxID=2499835 RepID=A0A437JU57_9BURK|nr:type IV secretion system protein [Rubrivivax albus]RVT50759.1 type IV secretion system protein [Rubrivivax albus]